MGSPSSSSFLATNRAVVWSSETPDADYRDLVDLIEFPEHAHHRWIRRSDYRQAGDQLRWAGQTTITEPVPVMRRLFAHAAKQKSWFRKVLAGVRENLSKRQDHAVRSSRGAGAAADSFS
jgi:hypothetical protein